jgi:hypothetical protein
MSSSSGPFTTAVPWRPTCPSVLVSSVIVYLTGPPDPRRHPFESGMRPYPASYAGPHTERLVICPGFLLPFDCRHSLLGSSFPRWGLGLPRGRLARQCPDPIGIPRFARMSCDCPLYPEYGGAHTADSKSPWPRTTALWRGCRDDRRAWRPAASARSGRPISEANSDRSNRTDPLSVP